MDKVPSNDKTDAGSSDLFSHKRKRNLSAALRDSNIFVQRDKRKKRSVIRDSRTSNDVLCNKETSE
jgi:hypothetical protein